MPSLRTEASEIAVAFGILGLDPAVPIDYNEVSSLFDGTLSAAKYDAFREEYSRNRSLYARMLKVGRGLRSEFKPFRDISSVGWSGPDRQATTASGAADLRVANTAVSVKAESDVVANLSPQNLLHNLPGGLLFSRNRSNWFLEQAPEAYQRVYEFVRSSDPALGHLPSRASEFERTAGKVDRKAVQATIGSYSRAQGERFLDLYTSMCKEVALLSAEGFNTRTISSLGSSYRTAVIEYIVRWFFRIGGGEYLLCGIDRDAEFAMRIPSLMEWKRDWTLVSVAANPDVRRKQSVVDLCVTVKRKKISATSYSANFHAEIRWSHGRFCGAPEAKLYKEFCWMDVPFLSALT